MNMKVYTCKKCHRTYTQIKGGSVCPHCRTYNPDYGTLIQEGIKILAKIITKK